MRTEIQHRWRYFDAARQRAVTTRHHCTAESIMREHPDATPVEGTRIERQIPETAAELAAHAATTSTSAWRR